LKYCKVLMLSDDEFENEDWKPLTDISPSKVQQSSNVRSSVFHRFDPFASKTLLNSQSSPSVKPDAAKSEPSHSKWRLTKIFSSSPGKKTAKNAPEKKLPAPQSISPTIEEDEDNFKEPIAEKTSPSAAAAPKVVESSNENALVLTKREFDAKLRELKMQQADAFHKHQKNLSSKLDSLKKDLQTAISNADSCKSDWDTFAQTILPETISLNEIIPEESDSSDETTLSILNEIEASKTQIKALKDSCKSVEEQFSKLTPIIEENDKLGQKETSLRHELDNSTRMREKEFSSLSTLRQNFAQMKKKLEEEQNIKQAEFDEKFNKLEKELKISQFYLKSENEKIEKVKAELESNNALLLELQNS